MNPLINNLKSIKNIPSSVKLPGFVLQPSRSFAQRTTGFNKANRRNSFSEINPFFSSSFPLFNSSSDFNKIFEEFHRLANGMIQLNNQVYKELFINNNTEGGKEQIAASNKENKENKDNTVNTASNPDTPAAAAAADSSQIHPIDSASLSSPGNIPINSPGINSPGNSLFMGNKLSGIQLDLDEENDKYVIKAWVPDFNKDQLKCRIKNGYLIISADVREEKRDDSGYISSTRNVTQSIKLPSNIQQNNIQAKFENGVLNIILPKKQASEPQTEQFQIQ